jgi:colanic acid biosynthesis protein WcaH
MAFLQPEIFRAVIRHTPLISIDLLVRDPGRRLLVGKRRNRPARDSWFVPGGRINKDERLSEAFSRLTREELGSALPFSHASLQGIFEHFYPDNALGEPGYGTHYVVLAYELTVESLALPAGQHSAYRWLADAELLADPQVHENTKAYCRGGRV